jgi:hypothetical protein
MSDPSVCRYSLAHYRFALEDAKSRSYSFLTCRDYAEGSRAERELVLRHDVDMVPERSLPMARLENSMSIRGTYFFRIHANNYNALGFEVIAIMRALLDMGHEIGLHAEPFDINHAVGLEPEESIRIGKEVLEAVLGVPIVGTASHNDFTPENNLDFFRKRPARDFGFLYEAYDTEALNLFEKSWYVSDGHPWHWRTFRYGKLTEDHRCMCRHIAEDETPIYVLLHPHLWYERHFHLSV